MYRVYSFSRDNLFGVMKLRRAKCNIHTKGFICRSYDGAFLKKKFTASSANRSNLMGVSNLEEQIHNVSGSARPEDQHTYRKKCFVELSVFSFQKVRLYT